MPPGRGGRRGIPPQKNHDVFLSAEDLNRAYGVDPLIAKAYVDRRVPPGNAYWKGRLLYMPPVPGYIFMPIFSDLCLRCGIPREALLSEECLSLAEAVLDSAARLEEGVFDGPSHVRNCLGKAEGSSNNPSFLKDLRLCLGVGEGVPSIQIGTPFPSLNRADTYLLSLAGIPFGADTGRKVAAAWTALMSYLLVQDDLLDLKEDLERGQENAFIDAGLDAEGMERVVSLVDAGLSLLSEVNPTLGARFMEKRRALDVAAILDPYMRRG